MASWKATLYVTPTTIHPSQLRQDNFPILCRVKIASWSIPQVRQLVYTNFLQLHPSADISAREFYHQGSVEGLRLDKNLTCRSPHQREANGRNQCIHSHRISLKAATRQAPRADALLLVL